MGEPTCVMPASSYASGISIEEKQGNPLHALGESVSFGRFMSESLAWDKWSTFSQNRHVEEAERFSQPGSVAQKKAFFEAHYKRIAAQKAAAAAALLEQENATTVTGVESGDCKGCETISPSSQVVADEQEELKNDKENVTVNADEQILDAKVVEVENGNVGGPELAKEPEVLVEISNNFELLDQKVESNETSKVEKQLLKDVSQMLKEKRPVLASLLSTMFRKVTSTPAKSMAPAYTKKENILTRSTLESTTDPIDEKRSTLKPLHKFINFTRARDADILSTPASGKIEKSRIAPNSYKNSKDYTTPLRNPTMASVNGLPGHSSITPCPESKRSNKALDPSASGRKLAGQWHLISSVCSKSFSACGKKLHSSTLSTPFVLRTEERAAKRKQKLEERFNEKEAQKVQIPTKAKEKLETVVSSQPLCFRARPLPVYRKQTTKKTPEVQSQSAKHAEKLDTSTIRDTKPKAKVSISKALKM